MGSPCGTSPIKRFFALGVLFALIGLVSSVSAFAAPFNDASNAARDQYTVTTPAPEAPTPPAPNTPAGDNAGNAPDGASGDDDDAGNAPDGESGDNDDDDDDKGVSDANDGKGSDNGAPSPSSGAGASSPAASSGTAPGRGGAAAAPRACNRPDIALLSIGELPPEVGAAFVSALGLPAWAGSMNATNPSLFASGSGCGATKFSGLPVGFDADDPKDMHELFRDTGEQIAPAGGLAGGLPGFLDDFNGSITPVTALVVSRSKIADPELRAKVEKRAKEMIAGAVKSGIPVVGIELKGTDPSSLDFFKGIDGVSFINDVDTARGQESLKRLVAGAKPGVYGSGSNVDAKTPPEVSANRSAAAIQPSQDGFGLVGIALLIAFVALSGRALFTVARLRT